MPKPRSNKRSVRNTSRLVAVLKQLVVPAFEDEADSTQDGPTFELHEPESGSAAAPFVQGRLRGEHLVHVAAVPVDDERTTLRFSLLAGYLIADCPSDAILIGNLLESTPFHIRADMQLGLLGRLSVGCDLIVREDDEPLVRRRFAELLQLAQDFQWFFPLRLAHQLHWQAVSALEIPFDELPHQDLGEFLDDGLTAPPSERTPLTLLRLAHGLGRWQDVLRLLREHPDAFPSREFAPLKCLAYRELRRWLPAIRAAKAGGIRNGRFPGAKWTSPSFVHSLIEGGDEIEALRILGKPTKGEPGFYDWLRALALHRAGDSDRAAEAFSRYFAKFPGDVLAIAAAESFAQDLD